MTLLISALVTAGSLPVLRAFVGPFFLDKPTNLKRHRGAIPAIGGLALMLGFFASLVFIRFTTDFPSGTLHNLRGIFIGAVLVFLLGVGDDFCKPKGVNPFVKLFAQAAASYVLILYDVHINLFESAWLSYPLTFLWVVGVTNAFNLLDILDGLCVSQAVVCALGLALISLPSEFIYVNFAAMAILGASLGFWPYNHIRKYKTFLGDSGSMLLGFIIAALAMGTGYSEKSDLGFLAPLLILAVPLFDTTFVFCMRLVRRRNPFLGSNDHAALRIRKFGLNRYEILWLFIAIGIFYNILAYGVTRSSAPMAVALYLFSGVSFAAIAIFLSQIEIK